MNYHYEVCAAVILFMSCRCCWSRNSISQTQPVPNPLSYYLHQTPELIHKSETLANHVIELIIPFFIFLPRPFRLICGVFQILFQVCRYLRFSLSHSHIYIYTWYSQVVLILSGNLSFLNWLTILPAIYCFDDLSLRWLFSSKSRQRVIEIQQEEKKGIQRPWGRATHQRCTDVWQPC